MIVNRIKVHTKYPSFCWECEDLVKTITLVEQHDGMWRSSWYAYCNKCIRGVGLKQ